jgi:hypothetical protein
MAIEIVDLPSKKMVIVHSFLYVYQRVVHLHSCFMNMSSAYTPSSSSLKGKDVEEAPSLG